MYYTIKQKENKSRIFNFTYIRTVYNKKIQTAIYLDKLLM